MVLSLVLAYLPALLFGLLFILNYRKEPRRFRNALYFLLFCLFFLSGLSVQLNAPWLIALAFAFIPLGTVLLVVFLLVNAVVVVRREGLSASSVLPALFAFFIIAVCILFPLFLFMQTPPLLLMISGLLVMEGSYVAFTFLALLLYSWLYRRLPRRRDYDYIVVHGAGLSGTKPTPLLAARLDKGVELWEAAGRHAILIVSGGQGEDEPVPEAQAMREYLVDLCGVPSDAVIMEDRSTSTRENLRNSKGIMDARSGVGSYRCAIVTSDYHVFRAAEYAHQIGLAADGVGSKTARYYWPAAFIREYAAISADHRWPFIALFVLWFVAAVVVLLEGLS